MPRKRSNRAVPCIFYNSLDGGRDVPHPRIFANEFYGRIQCVLCDIQKALCFFIYLTYRNCNAGICVERIKKDTAIHSDDVSFFEFAVRWDAVHTLLINGCAESCRVSLVTLEGGSCSFVRADELFCFLIEHERCNTRLYQSRDVVETAT